MSANAFLDLFSLSQTASSFDAKLKGERLPESDSDRANFQSDFLPCDYNAPLIAIPADDGKTFRVIQGNCHHWDCQRCGPALARKHYGRIVEGCRELTSDGSDLWFITITCRGSDLSLEDAEANYLKWTNRFLTAIRMKAKRAGVPFSYMAVTERQKRGHPHSHILTNWMPPDAVYGPVTEWTTKDGKRQEVTRDKWRSEWIQARVISAGLGQQYDLSKVESAAAVSRYVAKYLFKDTLLTVWPKGWKRVRYSQNWLKFDQSNPEAIALVRSDDYLELHDKRAKLLATGLDDKHSKKLLDACYGLWIDVRTDKVYQFDRTPVPTEKIKRKGWEYKLRQDIERTRIERAALAKASRKNGNGTTTL